MKGRFSMSNETLEVIKRRRSIRAFKPDALSKDDLCQIAQAGLYAPNGGGYEAWRFTAIQDKAVLERINRLAKQYAAGSGIPHLEQLGRDEAFHCLYHASAVVLVACNESGPCAEYDASAATQNILLAAESLGIASCWGYFATQAFMAGEGEALRRELGIPDGYRVYTSVMLGYGSGDAPPERKIDTGLVHYI